MWAKFIATAIQTAAHFRLKVMYMRCCHSLIVRVEDENRWMLAGREFEPAIGGRITDFANLPAGRFVSESPDE